MAEAFVYSFVFQEYLSFVQKVSNPRLLVLLNLSNPFYPKNINFLQVRDIFALHYISQHMGFYRNHEYFKSFKGNTIESLLVNLCEQLAPYSLELVNSFEIPDFIVKSPLGLSNQVPLFCEISLFRALCWKHFCYQRNLQKGGHVNLNNWCIWFIISDCFGKFVDFFVLRIKLSRL